MKIISVAAIKGGVGRTTIAANLASVLSALGRKVLAVDLDPQNALRFYFNAEDSQALGWARSILDGQDIREAILTSASGQYYLPFGELSALEHANLRARMDEHPMLVQEMLQGIELEDDVFVVLDTPGGVSQSLERFLHISNALLVVAKPEMASYATFPALQHAIETYCTPRADFTGLHYIINGVNPAIQLSKDITRFLLDELEGVSTQLINEDVLFPQSFTFGKTVYAYDQNSQVCHQIVAVAESLLATME